MNSWLNLNCQRVVKLADIPNLSALNFEQEVCKQMDGLENLILAYFACKVSDNSFKFYLLLQNRASKEVCITSFVSGKDVVSLSTRVPSISIFEREMAELYGINFIGNEWLKPVRVPFNRANKDVSIDDYPFYDLQNEYLHQVHVGPVHAGIIEPGAFRFICEGEKIHHLEISLGYQHRGVEAQICKTQNRLRQVCVAETIAGDTTIGHTVAMCEIIEAGWMNEIVFSERKIALELECIAMSIADTGALAMDSGYQLGQVACEALRTIVINTMQNWCGNRFGRTLVRPFGVNYRLDVERIEVIKNTLEEVCKRYAVVAKNLQNSPDFLARVDEICNVDHNLAKYLGAVGIAGLGGDILNRLKARFCMVDNGFTNICEELKKLSGLWFEKVPEPSFNKLLPEESIIFSIVDGWRGKIVHVALSDNAGEFKEYKIYDPSFRNWAMLAFSVRGAEISDFPLSNKSYNLSYCGNDL